MGAESPLAEGKPAEEMDLDLTTLRRQARANPGDRRSVCRFAHGLRRFGRPAEGFLSAYDVGVLDPDLEQVVVQAQRPLLDDLRWEVPCLRVAGDHRDRPTAGRGVRWPAWRWQPVGEFPAGAVLAVALDWVQRSSPDVGKLLAQLPVLREVRTGLLIDEDLVSGLAGSRTLRALSCALPDGGELLLGVVRLARLRALRLDTRVGEGALQEIGRLTQLESLALELADRPREPPVLPALRELDVRGPVDRTWLEVLCNAGGLPRLEHLSFSKLRCGYDDDLRPLSRLRSLRTLSLARGAGLRGDFVADLGPLQDLETLELSCLPRLEETALLYLADLPRLSSLTLSNCKLEPDWLAHLVCVTNLRSLTLECGSALEGWAGKLAELPLLEDLSWQGPVSGPEVERLCQAPSLTRLRLGCHQSELDSAGLAALAASSVAVLDMQALAPPRASLLLLRGWRGHSLGVRCECRVGQLEELIETLPNLRRLALSRCHCRNTDEIARRLRVLHPDLEVSVGPLSSQPPRTQPLRGTTPRLYE